MKEKETDFGSFFKENKDLLQDYLETRMSLMRLQFIKGSSKAIGTLIWFIVLLFLLFLLLIFVGLILGFWFSEITDSYVAGFSISAGILLLFTLLMTLLRRQIFVHPVIRLFIGTMTLDEESEVDDEEDE